MGVPAKVYPAGKCMNEDEIKMIKSIKLPPPLKPLNPSAINKHAQKTEAEVYEWIRQPHLCNMYSSPKSLQAHVDSGFPGLAARVYLAEGEKELVFASKMIMFTFALDDYVEEVTPEKSTALIWELNAIIMWSFPDDPQLRENFVKLLDGGDVAEREAGLAYMDRKCADARCNPGTVYAYDTSSPETLALCKAFGEIWETVAMAESTPRYFVLRWGLTLQLYILSYVTEIKNRNRNAIPTLADYIDLRRQTVAMDVFMDVVPFLFAILVHYFVNDESLSVAKAYVPDELFQTPEMRELLEAANDIVAMINDIYSFKKELLFGEVHNFVVVISNEHNCSFEEAVKRLWQMVLDRTADLDRAVEDMERVTCPEHKPKIALYTQLARTWISGSNDWSLCSPRYKMSSEEIFKSPTQ